MVEYIRHDSIAEIRIDDGKVNAMSPDFFDELNAALDRADAEKPGAVVLAGRAGYFSAGLDVKLVPTLAPDELTRTLHAFGHTLLRVWSFPIPTVAAVTGHAIAGGLFLSFACDLRIVAQGAMRLQANEHAIGLPLPSWALAIAESAVPVTSFTEVMLHARPFSPDEALARGFVTALAPADDVVTRAHEAAAGLAALSQPAYARSKRRIRSRALAWATPLIPEEMTGFPARR